MNDTNDNTPQTWAALAMLMSQDDGEMAPRTLIDQNGENLALRSFLMQYSCDRAASVADMAQHMRRSGWDGFWPGWVSSSDARHLTKLDAQRWIRHLLDLERIPVKIRPQASAALLDRIIDKLASGVGPDRELDKIIDLWRTCGCAHPTVRRYTETFDAAATLAPRLPKYQLPIYETGDGERRLCGYFRHDTNVFCLPPSAWPPAREICLAALTAHRDLKAAGLLQ